MSFQIAIQSLSAIKVIADGLISMRDETKVLEVKLSLTRQVIEVQQVLMALQSEIAALIQENYELKEQARKHEKLASERKGHDLYEVCPGAFVYAAKAVDGTERKPPYYCQPCYDSAKKSILTFQPALGGPFGPTLQCPINSNHKIALSRGVTAESVYKNQ